MKKIASFLAVGVLVAISGIAQAQSGQLVFMNNSPTSYTIFIDGVKRGRVPSGSSQTIDVSAGNHVMTARSDDGRTSSATYDFTRAIHRVTMTRTPKPRVPLDTPKSDIGSVELLRKRLMEKARLEKESQTLSHKLKVQREVFKEQTAKAVEVVKEVRSWNLDKLRWMAGAALLKLDVPGEKYLHLQEVLLGAEKDVLDPKTGALNRGFQTIIGRDRFNGINETLGEEEPKKTLRRIFHLPDEGVSRFLEDVKNHLTDPFSGEEQSNE